MGLFVTRYITSLLIFVLGLKAPGITVLFNMHQRLEEESQQTPADNLNRGSAFRNAFKKLRKLFPYLWPKKDAFLQITVLICILLLTLGRVIKLYLPIYRKKLGKSVNTLPTINRRWRFRLIEFIYFNTINRKLS